ncbi:PRC-barrel domain containing protein [Rhodovastum atsumiense]|uniref:PRC-barrel domain containing protein n=2 Tax=Rhodovastum atsumiense TaxID=504468 RepID=A0A5M6J0W2_9PROT|nr:PRC-barrel domain containing protein [Rhodovastum atsumiense]
MGSGATGTTGRDLNPGHSASSATPAGPTIGANTPGARNDTPSGRNPVLTDQSAVRASKLIGSSVYNDKGEQIGSIDDILMGQDNKAQTAVLSVGGFLGIGAKLVEVPYEQLQFGDTRGSSENRVKLPNATKDSLQSMPEYQYRGSHG